MLFTTTTQFVALALTLVAGWIFGLASHPGGKKWKQRYASERDAHAGVKKDADARVADANRRIAELEKDNARLAKEAREASVAPAPVAAAPATTDTVGTRRNRAAYDRDRTTTDGTRPGWFDFGSTRRA
ncbi:hypothetical protein ASE75_11580 [Sphingomonas sp. Leaf17]|uniref:hypothetical protein n=1 Tax=Sphingomonas sp. Leaf17 TaxID=1735683 RepID=UPI0006F394B7|nr:hypothetical protein [Sphingomonas sp. Leaf17]KQM63729.1 hypothetical protein ASE75_11580 [Sphingomonas sp. Leaf17]